MNAADVLRAAEEAGAKTVRFLYCDHGGIIRAKAVHVAHLENKLREGVGLTRAQMAMNVLDQLIPVEGMEPVGEIRLVPDLETFSPLPWTPDSASLICDQLGHDREDWGSCPRAFLKKTVSRARERGIDIRATFEVEFYLATNENGAMVPFDHAPVYSSIGLDQNAGIMRDIVETLGTQGIDVEGAINEYGPGQQEISIGHAGALRAADNHIKLRDAVRGVANTHGWLASFAPKSFPDAIGSGCHVHFSLWNVETDRALLFDSSAPRGLSALGRHAVGGLLQHLPALVALTCPSFNSYRRLQPHAWSSAFTAWGFDNREAAVRIASPFHGREEQSYNIELKTVDGSCNPYIALGGIITALLDGIDRKLEPGAPCESDPANLSNDERERRGIQRLPTRLGGALSNLEGDPVLTRDMKDLMRRSFIAVRRSEDEAFRAQDEAFEIANHFYKY